jgi:alpha-L-rhamnosidase
VAVLAGLPVGVREADASGREAIRAVRLTTEHLEDPLGIDVGAPRFGWQLEAGGSDRTQSSYQILVASTPKLLTIGRPDVWDSGRVRSAEQSAQAYGGPPLRSRTRYYWAVRAWDERERPGPRSDVAWFEMALLSEREWTADWVGGGVVIPPPVRVLPPRQYQGVGLEAGHMLGQTFVSPGPLVAVTILLALPEKESAGCLMKLRRNGPDGVVLDQKELSDLVGDKHDNASGRLDFAEPIDPGRYFLELSSPRGSVGWLTLSYRPEDDDLYPDGSAYLDGAEVDADRWLFGIPPDPPANPLLRKEFRLSEPVASARLYLCGSGQALAWVNGRRVGDAALSPVATEYDKRILYTSHDVTPLLRRGENAVGVALGRGFFATRAPDSDGTSLAAWIAEPQVQAQLEITLASGRRVTIGTGPDWSLTEGPTRYEGLLAGESYDARRAAELSGWASPGFDDQGWRPAAAVQSPGGRLEAYPGEQIRAGSPIGPVTVSQPVDGVRVFDFGVVLSGRARLRGRLAAGTTVRLVHSEKLGPSGRIDPETPGGVENPAIDGRLQVDEFTATGRGSETWQSSFTYKGFQYVEVTGTTAPLELVAVPVHSDLSNTMDIKLNHPVLQWIADAFRQTAQNGLHGYPDVSALSKVGWLGAALNAAAPMLYQFGAARLFAHWLDDIRLSQAPSGAIPMVAPFGGGPSEFLLSPSYVALYPYLVRRYWLNYGDQSVPEKHFDPVRRCLEWILGQLEDEIVRDDVFGDWYPPGIALGEYPRGPEGGRLVGTALVIQALRDGLALAEILGHTDVARTWRSRLDRMIRRFNEEFLDADAGLYRTDVEAGYRQASNAIPLAYDLVPPEYVDRVAANLAADVEARGRHLNTGSMGTGALPFALSDHGRPDLAVAVLGQSSYPSYGYLRGLGATTFWESWEPHSRARNDPTVSNPVQWLVERAVGVEAVQPGWARFRVAPRAVGSLPGAGIALDTVRGRIAVVWRRDGGDLVLDVRVPVSSVAEVMLPNGKQRELGSGTHHIVAPA